MNTVAIPMRRFQYSYLEGWILSLLFHGIIIGLSLYVVTSLHLPPGPTAFIWKVAFVEPKELVRENSEGPSTSPAISSSRSPVPTPERSVLSKAAVAPQSTPAEAQPTNKPVEQTKSVPIVRMKESIQTIQNPQSASPEEIKVVTSLTRESVPTAAQPAIQADQVISLPTRTMGAVVHEPALTSTNEVIESQVVKREPHATREATEVTSSPSTDQKHVSVETRVLETRPTLEVKLSPVPTELRPSPEDLPSNSVGTSIPQKTRKLPFVSLSMPSSPTSNVKADILKPTRSDLTWLQEKLDEAMKPTIHFEDVKKKIRGQVFFSIHQEQSRVFLDDVQIYESSGHVMIDREVIRRFKAVFPITLEDPMYPPQRQFVVPVDICINASSCADITF